MHKQMPCIESVIPDGRLGSFNELPQKRRNATLTRSVTYCISVFYLRHRQVEWCVGTVSQDSRANQDFSPFLGTP